MRRWCFALNDLYEIHETYPERNRSGANRLTTDLIVSGKRGHDPWATSSIGLTILYAVKEAVSMGPRRLTELYAQHARQEESEGEVTVVRENRRLTDDRLALLHVTPGALSREARREVARSELAQGVDGNIDGTVEGARPATAEIEQDRSRENRTERPQDSVSEREVA